MKIYKYKQFEIHLVNGTYKYDIWYSGIWFSSVQTLKDAHKIISAAAWTNKG